MRQGAAQGGWRRRARAFGELFVLCGFAVTQPILDVMGRSPEFLVFRQARSADLALLTLCLVIVPPVMLWAVETAVALVSERASRALHAVVFGGLMAAVAFQALKKLTPWSAWPVLAAGLAVGAAGVHAIARYRPVRLWMGYLTPTPIIFGLVFLMLSPASQLFSVAKATDASSGGRASPVVMIAFDEFPLMTLLDGRGRIDRDLYPNFARLADDSTWFRNTTSITGYTPAALPAILTGRYPAENLAPTAAQFPDNLFTMLAPFRDLHVYETITALCPPDVCDGSREHRSQGLQALLGDASEIWRQIASPERYPHRDLAGLLQEETVGEGREGETRAQTEAVRNPPIHRLVEEVGQAYANQPIRFQRFVSSLEPADRPTLSFLHLLLPHYPLRYLPSGLVYEAGDLSMPATNNSSAWDGQSWPPLHSLQRMMLQVVYADRLLGQVMDRMQRSGLYDRALFVIVADHGAGFVPGNRGRALSPGNAAQLAWVPFFVKAPGQEEGHIDDHNVQVVDVLPTLADLLDFVLPVEVDGRSALAGSPRTTTRKPWYNTWGHAESIDGEKWFPSVLRGLTSIGHGRGSGSERLYGIGPHGDLVGTAPQDHRVVPASGAEVTVHDVDAYGRVDPATGKVPALVAGRVDDVGDGDDSAFSVAVAVNGTIGGVSETYTGLDDLRLRFASMVPERLLRPGANRLDLFLVRGTGQDLTLEPVEVKSD